MVTTGLSEIDGVLTLQLVVALVGDQVEPATGRAHVPS